MNDKKEFELGDDCPYECSGYLIGDEDTLLVCQECEEILFQK